MSLAEQDQPSAHSKRPTRFPARLASYDLSDCQRLLERLHCLDPNLLDSVSQEVDDNREDDAFFVKEDITVCSASPTPQEPLLTQQRAIKQDTCEYPSPVRDSVKCELQIQNRLERLEKWIERIERQLSDYYAQNQRLTSLLMRGPRAKIETAGVAHESNVPPPTPTIPKMELETPQDFTRLKIALENLLPKGASERYKYQVLVDHIVPEKVRQIAEAYAYSNRPFTDTMEILDSRYGQPDMMAMHLIRELQDGPGIAHGDLHAYDTFTFHVRSLVSLLKQLGSSGESKPKPHSNVMRLIERLPDDLQTAFWRDFSVTGFHKPNLPFLADWLERERGALHHKILQSTSLSSSKGAVAMEEKNPTKAAASLYTLCDPSLQEAAAQNPSAHCPQPATCGPKRKYCPYCDHNKHSLNDCANFKMTSTEHKQSWIKANNRCWRCARAHRAAECDLRMRCKSCSGRHLLALHSVHAAYSRGGPVHGQP